MNIQYNPGPFAGVARSDIAKAIWEFLLDKENIVRMQTASDLRRPAIEPLSEHLVKAFGSDTFTHHTKQLVGHMVRQIMETNGYQLDAQGVPIRKTGNIFTSGSRFKKSSDKGEENP